MVTRRGSRNLSIPPTGTEPTTGTNTKRTTRTSSRNLSGDMVARPQDSDEDGSFKDDDASPPPQRRKKANVIKDSDDDDDEDAEGEEDVSMVDTGVKSTRSSSSRRAIAKESDEEAYAPPSKVAVTTHSGRATTKPVQYEESTDDEEEKAKFAERVKSKGKLRRGGSTSKGYKRNGDDFVASESGGEEWDDGDRGYGTSKRSTRANPTKDDVKPRRRKERDSSFESGDGDTPSEDEDIPDLHDESDSGVEDAKMNAPRRLREKSKVDYFRPLELEAAPGAGAKGKKKRKARMPFSMTGADYASLFPEGTGRPPQDSSSDDDGPSNPFGTPRKGPLFPGGPMGAGGGGFGGMFAGGAAPLDLAGTPNNLGKVGAPAALADTDPLGVSSTVSFDSVGGLGSHIQQLKEMVSLPLLYPEVFERFNITPPRGVLFHGPPGTGKTLLARALAASCSTEGRKISFFMRKGADCLSKWVGEAERQLRLLFEEAKKCQPSIIFFDEIDGLAPVRSSKQEQIHASIVSTLLALMDGMDGRGQVIVIGATNRPDAIDPALRRPGRFDREFYFPLPNREGRRKIIDIHTSGWEPPIADSFKDELAMLTKGYGGADLRALCTEAALNAVQRTYPQIYKTNDRLVIEPKTIDVTARDFVISQKNLIPSSARATSSAASPLPTQLVPLLEEALEKAKQALKRVLPDVKKANVLEEAEWEDDGGGFEKEKMLQAYQTLRIFRPRMVICGEAGHGQSYIGAAVLHHLEGFHVQSLDLATLVSDSGRTMEAACVQLFVEAKRHKPSILFIPNLITWSQSVSEAVKSTIKGLLEGLDTSDPILLLAVIDGEFEDLPRDIRSWFGFGKTNRIVLDKPSSKQRRTFFQDVVDGIRRPPNEFPDAMPRRKRVLAKLAVAPPPPPREPTVAEIEAQTAQDKQLMDYLIWKMTPIMHELKKTYRKFTRSLYDDWITDDLNFRQRQLQANEAVTGLGQQPYFNVNLDKMATYLFKAQYYTPDEFLNDILRIQSNAEVNAVMENDQEAPVRAGQMVNHVRVMIDQTFDAAFRSACARMAERLIEKEKKGLVKPRKHREHGNVPAAPDDQERAKAAAAAGGSTHFAAERRASMGASNNEDGEQRGSLKRVRMDGVEEEEDATPQNGDSEAGPSKRAKGVNGLVNGAYDGDDTTASTSALPLAPLIPSIVAPIAPPMPVGAAPAMNMFSAEPLASIGVVPAFLPPQASTIEPVASTSTAHSEPPVAPTPREPSPIEVDEEPLPPPVPNPPFVLSQDRVEALWNFLSDGTSTLNVDQLEQLRAICFDLTWHGKEAWERDALVEEIWETAKDFVEEVEATGREESEL